MEFHSQCILKASSLTPLKNCWKGTKSAIFTFDSSVNYAGKAFLQVFILRYKHVLRRELFLSASFFLWNIANRLFLAFWSSEGPSLMDKTLKCYLNQEILLGFSLSRSTKGEGRTEGWCWLCALACNVSIHHLSQKTLVCLNSDPFRKSFRRGPSLRNGKSWPSHQSKLSHLPQWPVERAKHL